MRGFSVRAVALLLVAALLLPSVALGATPGAQQTPAAEAPDSWSPQNTTTANNTTTATTTPENGSGEQGALKSAETARISPLRFEQKWLSVKVVESDSVFNTSGPFVLFSVSERVKAVRISQKGADAQLLEGGHGVRVNYAKDAAPDPKKASLYTLELYYADGSSEKVKLYARKTSVSVEAAQLSKYKEFLYEIRGDAEDAGYAKSPSGVEKYYKAKKEQAELLNSLFVEQAARAVSTIILWFTNPIGIGVSLLIIAVGSAYRMRKRGYALDIIANDSGKAQRLRERLRLTYRANQQTADEERLKELPKIGSMSEVYWRDAQGASTVYQLAELARSGRAVKRGGELVQAHHGVSDLQAGNLEETWLESVSGQGRNRVASYDIALSHMKTALERMMSTYGMGHIYRDTYEDVVELIEERQQIVREGGTHRTTAGTGAGAGAAAGGD